METRSSVLPDSSPSDIQKALETFDREHRGEGRWNRWQSNQNHKYAIEHEGRRYPVKQVVSLATGRPTSSFSGGDQANGYVEQYGFEVAPLRGATLNQTFEQLLSRYLEARKERPFGSTDEDGNTREIWGLFEQAERMLEESAALSQRPHVEVEWSAGQDNWARVPWIAFLDERETTTTQEGVYVVYLFRQDLSGVYLTYNQGVTKPTDTYGRRTGYALLQNRAERLRRRAPGLAEQGFTLDSEADLRADRGLGRDYEVSTVAYKLYEPGEVPRDEALLSDLGVTLQAYDRYASSQQRRGESKLDRTRLREATDGIIRPAIYERGDLEDEKLEGYQHHSILPKASVCLTPSELEERPTEAMEEAINADKNLLSSFDKMYAETLLEILPSAEVREQVSELLYGAEPLEERVQIFLEWGRRREPEEGVVAQFTGTFASYLLAFSDPEEYAFCKTRHVYRPAVKALLGEDEKKRDWPERIAHAQSLYKEALQFFQEQELPFNDLLHVHIAFYLAENEDEDAPWGEGVLSTADGSGELLHTEGQTVVKIAPGHGAKYWDDCREGGYVCVGWDDVGDLRQYNSREELRDAFREAYHPGTYETEQKVSKKSSEVWALRQLDVGDLVVANRGVNEVLAVGEVVEPGYEWQPDRSDHRHTVHVEWDESYAQEIPRQGYWGFVTVRELSNELSQHILDRRGMSTSEEDARQSYQPPAFERIYETVQERGMATSRQTLLRYHVSLRTRGFVILSGVSGTGKTWLTELYAKAVKARRLLQPVAPNWTANEDLLGYYNPVDETYHHSEVSRFLQEAEAAYDEAQERGSRAVPYHLVLDEMNLARVEYYFAKFLSKMEEKKRGGAATLHLGDGEKVRLTPNLFVIGTVNIDETTHAFADKVYDRAQLIEMEAPRDKLRTHIGDAPHAGTLMEVWDKIGGVAPFAFRVLDEIDAYIEEAQVHGSSWQEALDEQLLQKVLPKVKGTEPAVGEALRAFLEAAPKETYPLSHTKTQRMLDRFKEHGFTSYFE